jgi:tRNA-dihydrouridine synthase
MLAPLEDTSDNALRTLCHRYGADITFTEMAYTLSLAHNNQSALSRTLLLDDTPTWIQITGAQDNVLKRYLAHFEPKKGFLGFNFNVGCPSPHVIRVGLGCAMIKRISKMKKMVQIVKDYGYYVSIKMRLGMNRFEREKKVYLNLIDAVDVDFFAVHCRYGAQTYENPADYSAIIECVKTGKTIIANGDIIDREQVEWLRSQGVQGVMIGRAAVFNPAVFNLLKWGVVPSLEQLEREYLELSDRFQSPFKYRKNVLKRLGSPLSTIKEMQSESVMG